MNAKEKNENIVLFLSSYLQFKRINFKNLFGGMKNLFYFCPEFQ